ncbi:hypothetical protein ACHAXN_004677 [Cyclotella atomus]
MSRSTSRRSKRSSAIAGAAAIVVTWACLGVVSQPALASPNGVGRSSVRKFPFINRRPSSTTDVIPTIEPESTPLQNIKRGGGLTKKKLKGAATNPATAAPPQTKKMVKKLKKKRALKSATAIKSKLDKPESQMNDMNKMPSIFHEDEQKYDRYAAALAVTEGLRRIRDAEVERTKAKNKKTDSKSSSAESEFLLQSTKAVKALGLTVAQFNEIGREVLNNEVLKERVSEQAYLYRMASTVNLERIPLLQDPTSKKLLASPKHKRHRVQMFARSITEIEELRTDEMEALKQSLQVERFPPGFDLTDPQVMPLLHPEVRAVCEKFPVKAEEIVKRYGLESEEFNRMLEETKGNPIFRWRVQKYVEKAEEERRREKK